MFNKFKLRKAPLSLSSVSNAIKLNSEANLLPTNVSSKQLSVVIAAYLGLPKNLILAVAYDLVQLLFAVATKNNEVRVFGQSVVEVVFQFKLTAPITELRFVKGVYLLAILPLKGDVTVLSLYSKQILGTFSVPGLVELFETDYSLDFLLCGLANGQMMVYDIDRLLSTPFRVDNLQKRIWPKQKMSPIYQIEWHPRDIGTVLLVYSHLAFLYSFPRGDILQLFLYVLERDYKGFEFANMINGKKKMFGSTKQVLSEIKEAHFHPNGLHIVTVHTDNTLCFWDTGDGTLLMARSLFEVDLHFPGTPLIPAKEMEFSPITAVRWVCSADPEITQLLITGGDPKRPNVINVLDFGATLKYTLTSHERQSIFYAKPQGGFRQIPFNFYGTPADPQVTEVPEQIVRMLPITPPDFCYFNGNHDPHYIFLLSNYGSLYLVPYSSMDAPINADNIIIPPSLTSIVPPSTFSKVGNVLRVDWYSILSLRKGTGSDSRLTMMLRGGQANEHGLPKPVGANLESRAILVSGHELGVVRLTDVLRDSNHNPELVMQLCLSDSLFDYGHPKYLNVQDVSVAFGSREMLVALVLGEVVICKFGKLVKPKPPLGSRQDDYHGCPVQHALDDAKLLDITLRAVGTGVLTFLPLFLLQLDKGEFVSAIKVCGAGFGAVAYSSGRLVVCDITRGPAVIFNCKQISELLLADPCYATALEFTIMEDGQDGFSLLMLLVGTNGGGHFMLLKIVPMGNGGWKVEFSAKTANLNYRRLSNDDPAQLKLDGLIPVNASTGGLADALNTVFDQLGHGIVVPGYVIATSNRDIRVIKLPKTKLSHKVIDETCLCLGIVHMFGGTVLACLTRSGFFKLLLIPALLDVCDVKLPKDVYEKLKASLEQGADLLTILLLGVAFLRTSVLDGVALLIYPTDVKKNKAAAKEPSTDTLFNETAIIPPRPTALAMLWAKGQSTWVTSEDLSELMCGANRKPPKHQETELAYNILPEANPNQVYGQRQTAYDPSEHVSKAQYDAPKRKGQGGSYYDSAGMFGQGFVRSLQNGLNVAEETFHSYANLASEAMNEGISETKLTVYTSALKLKAGF